MSINPRFHNIFNFEFMTKLTIINNASWWGLSSGWRVSGHWSLYAISDALYHSSWVLNSSYETHQFSGSCPCLFPFQGSRIKVLQFSKKNLLVNLSMAKSNTTSVVKFVGELGRNSAFFLPAAQSPRESKLTQGITKNNTIQKIQTHSISIVKNDQQCFTRNQKWLQKTLAFIQLHRVILFQSTGGNIVDWSFIHCNGRYILYLFFSSGTDNH